MCYGKTITTAAAILLGLGLWARADEGEDPRRRPEPETAEQRRDAEAAERERGRPDRPPRGRARGEAMMPGGTGAMMPGGTGAMMPNGMRGMMGRARGMMWPEGMEAAERMDGRSSLERLRETDPEMFELEQNDQRLERESHELAEQYHRAPEGPARDAFRAKLQETVTRHFKARQERRELEVKRLQAQLERLRGAVKRRAKDADAIIDRRMSQLLGEEDFGF
jgi:hypothetical protein